MSSIYGRDILEPETLKDIEERELKTSLLTGRQEYNCGCLVWGKDDIYVCEFHQGFDYGIEICRGAGDG